MPFPLSQLSTFLASLILQPTAAGLPHHCGKPPATVPDCCARFAASEDVAAFAPPTHSSAQSAPADERTKSDANDR